MFIPLLANLFRGTRGMQYVATIIGSMAVTATQTQISWSSPSLPKLTGDNSPLGTKISGENASWIVSSLLIAGLPMGIFYHITIARFGRKQLLHVSSVALFVSWFFIIFGNRVEYIYVGRVLAGLVIAVTTTTAALYCSEIADVDIRGRLGTSYGIMKILGAILVLSVGPFVSYVNLAVILAVIPFSLFCLLFFIPESPYSLVRQNRIDEAKEAVRVLSGSVEEVEIDKRMKAILMFVQNAEKPLGYRSLLKEPKNIKAIACVITVVVLEYFSGYNAIGSYQQQIISDSQSMISPEISSIMFGLIQIPAAIISAFLVDRLGRKIILYIGLTGCIIALTIEGAYFYLESYVKADVTATSWIPTTGIVLYLILHSVHAAVPYIILGEYFTDNIKNVATSIFTTAAILSSFLSTKMYEPIKEFGGLYTILWIYAGCSCLAIFATYFCLVETKNKTFAEIEEKVYH